jgi:hypothetical protein
MKIFLLFSFLMASVFTEAGTLKSVFKSVDETIIKTLRYDCSQQDIGSCQELCGQNYCEVEEPVCMNCAGSSNELLKVLFEKAGRFYKTTNQIYNPHEILSMMFSQSIVVLDSQSIYNFYTDISTYETEKVIKSLCPHQSTKAAIVVALDESGFPDKPILNVCQSIDGIQRFYAVEQQDWNHQREIEQLSAPDFYSESTAANGLRLKFEYKLNLKFEYKLKMKKTN